MLTAEQKQKYLEGRGVSCPYCGSENGIEGGPVEIDAGTATQEITCNECNEAWTDIYKLVDLEEEE